MSGDTQAVPPAARLPWPEMTAAARQAQRDFPGWVVAVHCGIFRAWQRDSPGRPREFTAEAEMREALAGREAGAVP